MPPLNTTEQHSTTIHTTDGRTTSARKPLYAAQNRLSAAHAIAARLLIVGRSFPSSPCYHCGAGCFARYVVMARFSRSSFTPLPSVQTWKSEIGRAHV